MIPRAATAAPMNPAALAAVPPSNSAFAAAETVAFFFSAAALTAAAFWISCLLSEERERVPLNAARPRTGTATRGRAPPRMPPTRDPFLAWREGQLERGTVVERDERQLRKG